MTDPPPSSRDTERRETGWPVTRRWFSITLVVVVIATTTLVIVLLRSL